MLIQIRKDDKDLEEPDSNEWVGNRKNGFTPRRNLEIIYSALLCKKHVVQMELRE